MSCKMLKNGCFLLLCCFLMQCNLRDTAASVSADPIVSKSGVQLVVLGTVQDGGAPHIGCTRSCCQNLWENPVERLKVVSLGIIDFDHGKTYMLEATPDFPKQLAYLNDLAGFPVSRMPDGIFITHAHIGHYTGLMYLGREAKGAQNVPVYVMPKLQDFLTSNGPWDQLVKLGNIRLQPIQNGVDTKLSETLAIMPFRVPHRDEYSETVGFRIKGAQKQVLFIPDIDKWSIWEEDIVQKIKSADHAFVDATFFDAKEINNRDIAEIPHPFVIESMSLFDNLPLSQKDKIHFIHLNHTNPLLNPASQEYLKVESAGYHVAELGYAVAL